jgi:hypothetical protein
VDHGALLALYAAGASVADVAIELRCSVVTVRRTVHKAGLPMRRVCGAQHPLRIAEPQRRCLVCRTTKQTTSFEVLQNPPHLNTVCVDCSGSDEAWAAMRASERECRRCGTLTQAGGFFQPTDFICKRCHLDGCKKRSAATKEERRAYGLRWQRANKAKCRAAVERRRARKNGAPVVDLTEEQWRERLVEFEHCCAYCGVRGQRLEKDHIIPIARHGSHTKSNVVPACRSCNASKCHRTLSEWLSGVVVSRALLKTV